MMNDDEILSAYLDNELTDAQRLALENRLESDPALDQRLQQMKATVLLHKASLGNAQSEPVPDAVAQMLEMPESAPWWSQLVQKRALIPATVAFSAALLWLVLPDSGRLPDFDRLESQVVRVLDTQLSGTQNAVGEGQEVELVLSFETKDQGWCREFYRRAAERAVRQIACKKASQWHIAATDELEISSSVAEQFRTASGGEADATEQFFNRFALGDPLSLDAEKARTRQK